MSVANELEHPTDRRRRGRRIAALCAVMLVVLAVAGMASTAVADDAPPAPVTNSWALAPTGTDPSQPGSRPNLSYSLDPGATIDDSVTLWNYSPVQLVFDIYATDAFNTATGGFDLLTGDKQPKDVGSWVKLPQNAVTVPAESSIVLPITITVPADARPGDHAAGIVASSKTPATDAQGHHVVLDRRTGSRIYLRVNGALNPALTVENVESDYQSALNPLSGELDVTYTVRNTGNVRLGAHQRIDVHDLFGDVTARSSKTTNTAGAKKSASTLRDIPELIPGNAITLHAHFTDVAATVRVSTDVTITPVAGGGVAETGLSAPLKESSTTRSTTTWAIPWSLVFVLLALGVLIAVVRWRRNSTQPARPPRATTQPAILDR